MCQTQRISALLTHDSTSHVTLRSSQARHVTLLERTVSSKTLNCCLTWAWSGRNLSCYTVTYSRSANLEGLGEGSFDRHPRSASVCVCISCGTRDWPFVCLAELNVVGRFQHKAGCIDHSEPDSLYALQWALLRIKWWNWITSANL